MAIEIVLNEKTGVKLIREVIYCSCDSVKCDIRISKFSDDDNAIYMEFFVAQPTFWERIKMLFGWYKPFHELVLEKQALDHMIATLQDLGGK